MLNLNSPTVQAMLQNTPHGYGNMPVYFGNGPTVTSETNIPQQQQQTYQSPFPSPKDMIAQGGQQMIYSPTSFMPRNIVGGYNPGYNAAFSGYYNPYMGIGAYGGYNYMMAPPDADSKDRLDMANFNGMTYDEQLEMESSFYSTISRIVSKNVGRSEEEAEACAAAFSPYNKYPKENPTERKKVKPLHIKLKIGDEVVADMNPSKVQPRYEQDYIYNAALVENMKYRSEWAEAERVRRCNMLYDGAPERQFDHMDLLDFFNYGAGVIMADMQNRILYEQASKRVTDVYDQNDFRKRLLENNGLKSKKQTQALERFVGRYGVMPDGRPVSPGHDPAVATSFSYNPNTGQYEVTAPNFLSNRLEAARQSFIRAIDSD